LVLDDYHLIEALEEVENKESAASAVVRALGCLRSLEQGSRVRSEYVARPFRSISIGFSSTPHGTAEYLTENFHHFPLLLLIGLRMAAPACGQLR
jgi:hypothetical protein